MNWEKVNTDRIIGLSAMLISLLTLIIFIYQTSLMRTQSRLSVTPRIGFSQAQSSKDTLIVFSLRIINKGLGPAIIESIEIVHKGSRYKMDLDAFLEEVYPQIGRYLTLESSTQMSKGSTLAAGESKQLYKVNIPERKVDELLEYMELGPEESPFFIEVVYSSIYNEKWKYDSEQDGHPIPL